MKKLPYFAIIGMRGSESMSRLKTFLIYVILIALFWVFSDFLINVGINSTYKPIESQSINNQIDVIQAEATLVSGRIKGVIHNSPENNISNKYVEIQLFAEDDDSLGNAYVDIGEVAENEVKPLDAYFKVNKVRSYKLDIVDQKKEETFEVRLKDLTKMEIVMGVFFVLILLW